MITLNSKDVSHLFVCENPIMHVVAHHAGIQEIAVTNFHPNSYRLGRAVQHETLVKFPSTVRRLRVIRPLLVYKCSGISENPAIKLRVVPSHDQGASTS